MQFYNTRHKMTRAWMSAVLLTCALPAHAFVFTVNSVDDAVDANPSDGVCATAANVCSLRAAIQQANAWPGHDFIVLPAGAYELSLGGRGENAAASGDLDITEDLTLRGAGADATIIDADGIDRVFDIIGQTTRVEISGVTITKGAAQPQTSPADDGTGGGIRSRGLLTLRDATVRDNASTPSNPGFAGGGIHHFNSTAANELSLLLDRVTVSGNIASSNVTAVGGGIAMLDGIARIERSVISGNSAQSSLPPPQGGADGGGLAVGNGQLSMSDTTISGNRADRFGGGMSTFGAGGPDPLVTVQISRSTISGNTAYRGAGIYDNGSIARTLRIVNSTISGNTAEIPAGSGFTTGAVGGGLFLSRPTELVNVTIADNEAMASGAIHLDQTGTSGPGGNQGSASILNSIIQAGTGGTCGGATANITSAGPNVGTAECASSIIAGAQLGPLASGQGGPTAVHVPQAGSPAIGAGSTGCPGTDQRGFARPAGSCTLGAVEAVGGTQADLAVTVLDVPDPVAVNTDYSYVMTVVNQGPSNATGAEVSLALPAGTTVSGLGSCASAGATVSCNLGALNAGAEAVRTVSVTANAEGTLNAEVSATATQNDPVTENSIGVEVTTQAYQPTDLVLTLEAQTTGIVIPAGGNTETTGAINEGDTIIAGQPFTFRLTLDNTGGTAYNTRILTTLPAGIVPAASAAFRIGNGAATPCSIASQRISCELGDLPEGSDVATITIPARPTERGTKVTIASGNFDGAFINTPPSDSLSINVDTRADLGVTMASSPNPVTVGADLGYIVPVSNAGPSDATAPEVFITLADNVEFRSASASGWDCGPVAGGVNCARDGLSAGTDSVITVFVTPQAVGPVDASATVSGDDTDPNSGNNTASVTTVVIDGSVNAPDLAVSMAATPNPGIAGENLSFVSTVTNVGAQVASSVELTQTLPSGVAFQFATEGCQRAGDFVQCDMGTIIPGTSASVTVVVRPNNPGSLSTSAVVLDAGGRDANLTNNTASLSVQVNQPTDAGAGLRTSGRCFIATAAWGSYMDPHVAELRRFRDEFLLTNAPGRAFVAWYYEVSPPIAEVIAEHEALRAATRWALTPLVYTVAYPVPTGLMFLLIAGVLYRQTRRRAD